MNSLANSCGWFAGEMKQSLLFIRLWKHRINIYDDWRCSHNGIHFCTVEGDLHNWSVAHRCAIVSCVNGNRLLMRRLSGYVERIFFMSESFFMHRNLLQNNFAKRNSTIIFRVEKSLSSFPQLNDFRKFRLYFLLRIRHSESALNFVDHT